MFWSYISKIFILFFLLSCSTNNVDNSKISNQDKIPSPESKYTEAMIMFDKKQYGQAVEIFKNIERIYPLSNEAIQSQIMQGFTDYIILDYESAIYKFDKIINKYPSLKNIDYVYYMRALSYYEQISHEGLDGKYNDLALKSLNQVIKRFPNTKYAKDSYQKIILVKSNIAAKHISIGRFYQKQKKYTAALNRYKIVVDTYQETKFVAEALYRISEIYLTLGMIEESKKTAAILGYNYPDSEWYKYIYKKHSPKSDISIFSRSIDKIFN